MGPISSYATLTSAIADWLHRSNITSALSSGVVPTDYFIQSAQGALESDIPDLNFGNFIRLQEVAYGPFPVVNGVAPVPIDWMGPRMLSASNGTGTTWPLQFASASWLLNRYSQRQSTSPPAYIARDVWQTSYAQPQSFTATNGQTVFALSAAPPTSAVLLVTLDGVALTQGVSYTLSGSTLTLTSGAAAGQILAVQYLQQFSGTQVWTAADNQASFQLNNPDASVVALTLDGAIFTAGKDFNVSAGFIALTQAAQAGQTLTAYLASGSVFIFGPYPDASYLIGGSYYARAPLLSASQTTNWMVNSKAAADTLLACCLREAYLFLSNDQRAQTWNQTYQQRLKALVDRDKAERWSSPPQINLG